MGSAKRTFALQMRPVLVSLTLLLASILSSPANASELVVTRAQPDIPVYPQYFSVVEAPDRTIYVGGLGAVLHYDGIRWQKISMPTTGPVRQLHLDRNQRLWVGGWNFIGYLERQADGEDKLTTLPLPPGMATDYEFLDVWRVHERDEGVYFGALRDLMLYGHDGAPIRYWHHAGRFGAMADDGSDLIVQFRGDEGGLRRLVGLDFIPIEGTSSLANHLMHDMTPLSGGRLLLHDMSPQLAIWQGQQWQPLTSVPRAQLDHFTSALGLGGDRVLYAGNDGVLRTFDVSSGELNELALGEGFVMDLKFDRSGAILALDELGLARIEQPDPWQRFGKLSGLRGKVEGLRWIDSHLWVLSGAGVFVADAPEGIPISTFERHEWATAEGYDLLAFEDGSKLIADSYTLKLAAPDRNASIVGPEDLYPRIIMQSQSNAELIWVGAENCLAAMSNDGQNWRLAGRYDLPGYRVLSLVELDDQRILASFDGLGIGIAKLGQGAGASTISFEWLEKAVETSAQEVAWLISRVGDQILVSTPSGFKQWDGLTLKDYPMPELSGLRQEAEVLALEKGKDGTLWAFSELNIYAKPVGGTWQLQYSAGSNDAPLGGHLLLPDGRLLIGANSTLLQSSVPKPIASADLVEPYLAALTNEGEDGQVTRLPLNQTLTLHSGSGVLRFQLAYPDFKMGSRASFSYRLVGLGDTWSAWSAEPTFSITGLKPGHYSFEYRVRRGGGQPLAGKAFNIEIKPRWYERVSAQGAGMLAIAALFALVVNLGYRRRAARLTRLNASLDQLVQLRTVELETANAQLRELAELDGLTGVANRRHLDQQLAEAVRYGGSICLALADVDHFKQFNDTHGHLVGDATLKRVAAVLAENARSDTLVARYGGEEFAIILPRCSLDDAWAMTDRLRQMVETHLDGVTISMGIAALDEGEQVEDLIARADKALYQAKHAGRNRVEKAHKPGSRADSAC